MARQHAPGRVFGQFWNQNKWFLRSEPGALASYPHPVLTTAVHLSTMVTSWFTMLLVTTQVRSATLDSPSCKLSSWIHSINREVLIAKEFNDTGEPCGTLASNGCLSISLPSIIISTVLSDWKLSVHPIRSPRICLTFMALTSLPFATLRKASLMSIWSTPVIWPFVQAAISLFNNGGRCIDSWLFLAASKFSFTH